MHRCSSDRKQNSKTIQAIKLLQICDDEYKLLGDLIYYLMKTANRIATEKTIRTDVLPIVCPIVLLFLRFLANNIKNGDYKFIPGILSIRLCSRRLKSSDVQSNGTMIQINHKI